jgi:hypothetical protein
MNVTREMVTMFLKRFLKFTACPVPVIVLFTKFDALLTVAMGKMTGGDRRLPLQEKMAKAHELVEGIFDNADVWGRLSRLTHPPKCSIRMEGMYHVSDK